MRKRKTKRDYKPTAEHDGARFDIIRDCAGSVTGDNDEDDTHTYKEFRVPQIARGIVYLIHSHELSPVAAAVLSSQTPSLNKTKC